MEKRESSERELAIERGANEPQNEPQNELPKEPPNATKEDQGSTTGDSSDLHPTATKAPEDGWEYITGVKLFLVIGMVTLACFIMLLDTSIVSTVSETPSYPQVSTWKLTDFGRPFRASQVISIPLVTLVGMAAVT